VTSASLPVRAAGRSNPRQADATILRIQRLRVVEEPVVHLFGSAPQRAHRSCSECGPAATQELRDAHAFVVRARGWIPHGEKLIDLCRDAEQCLFCG
jgi:hypothetical protein